MLFHKKDTFFPAFFNLLVSKRKRALKWQLSYTVILKTVYENQTAFLADCIADMTRKKQS